MTDHTTPMPNASATTDAPPVEPNTPVEPVETPQPEQTWITGPSSPTVLAGLLTLVISALAVVRLATDVEVDWSVTIPVTVIAVGFMAVVLGAASVARRSRRAEHESTE